MLIAETEMPFEHFLEDYKSFLIVFISTSFLDAGNWRPLIGKWRAPLAGLKSKQEKGEMKFRLDAMYQRKQIGVGLDSPERRRAAIGSEAVVNPDSRGCLAQRGVGHGHQSHAGISQCPLDRAPPALRSMKRGPVSSSRARGSRSSFSCLPARSICPWHPVR